MRHAVIFAIVVGCASKQRAQPTSAPRPAIVVPPFDDHCVESMLSDQERKKRARGYFRNAMKALANSDFETGIAGLENAYCVLPHPNVAYNLARTHAEVGAYRVAIAWYWIYLASKPADAAEVEDIIRSIERHLALRGPRGM